MSTIAQQVETLRASLPKGVKLMAVSKYYPVEAIAEAYTAGQRLFGESRVQELCPKREALPEDIEWHFIGTLQSNKVKYIAPFVHTIHSVDSEKLLREIERQAAKHGRIIRVLFELHLAKEDTKHGLSPEKAIDLARSIDHSDYPHIEFAGVMTMGTFTDDHEQVRREFQRAAAVFAELRPILDPANTGLFRELSMGMSDDHKIAIEEGSTIVRIGSALFS